LLGENAEVFLQKLIIQCTEHDQLYLNIGKVLKPHTNCQYTPKNIILYSKTMETSRALPKLRIIRNDTSRTEEDMCGNS